MFTIKATRLALVAAALVAAGATAADAKPRRVVILDFDGPRTLADSGRAAVVNLLGEQYDVVASKRWAEARAQVKDVRGPQGWRKAAKASGVDAVIEGWIQDEGAHKLLYVLVRDASTGDEVDKVSVKLGKAGVTATNSSKLRSELDEVLESVEANPDIGPKLPTVNVKQAREMVGAKSRLEGASASDILVEDQRERSSRRGKLAAQAEGDEAPRAKRQPIEADEGDDVTERRAAKPVREVATATAADREKNDALVLLGPEESVPWLAKPVTHVPQPTPRFALSAGGWYGSRSFLPEGDSDELQDYAARSKGFQLHASVYPFPTKKMDGIQSGLGFSASLYRSAGSEVVASTDQDVGTYQFDQNGFEGAVHYRQPLGLVSLDGEVGYSRHNYTMSGDFPLDVPDTAYSAFHAGARLDLHITDRATIGVGGKMFYVLNNGPMSDLEWYGPGSTSGLGLDASFVVPLPRSLFVRGDLSYRRFSTTLDGVGDITEADVVFSTADATMNGSVNLGIQF